MTAGVGPRSKGQSRCASIAATRRISLRGTPGDGAEGACAQVRGPVAASGDGLARGAQPRRRDTGGDDPAAPPAPWSAATGGDCFAAIVSGSFVPRALRHGSITRRLFSRVCSHRSGASAAMFRSHVRGFFPWTLGNLCLASRACWNVDRLSSLSRSHRLVLCPNGLSRGIGRRPAEPYLSSLRVRAAASGRTRPLSRARARCSSRRSVTASKVEGQAPA